MRCIELKYIVIPKLLPPTPPLTLLQHTSFPHVTKITIVLDVIKFNYSLAQKYAFNMMIFMQSLLIIWPPPPPLSVCFLDFLQGLSVSWGINTTHYVQYIVCTQVHTSDSLFLHIHQYRDWPQFITLHHKSPWKIPTHFFDNYKSVSMHLIGTKWSGH